LSALTTNYVALRVREGGATEAWLAAARKRRDAPPAIRTLLAGRSRVEVAQWEAEEALAWAGSVDGWDGAEMKPLFVHPGARI
jgi:hypothetical protein